MRYVATLPTALMKVALALKALGPVTVTSLSSKELVSTPLLASA